MSSSQAPEMAKKWLRWEPMGRFYGSGEAPKDDFGAASAAHGEVS